MAEIDLIPADFRRHQGQRRRLQAAAIGYVALVVLLLAARLWLGQALQHEKTRIAALTAEENVILQQRQTVEQLQGRRGRLQEHLTLLETLRGGPKVEQLFVAMDRAINEAVWIVNWKFLRAGEKAASPPLKPGNGYLVATSGEAASPESWDKAMRMEINGQALSHSTLADFVNALQDQPEIAEVKLQSTTEGPYRSGLAIAFQLSVRVVVAEEGTKWKIR